MRKFLACIILGFSANAFAADIGGKTSAMAEDVAERINEGKPSLGIRLGYQNSDRNFKSDLEYGIEAGFQAYGQVSAALELSGTSVDRRNNDPVLTQTRLLAKALYNFGGTTPVIRYSYVGAGLGPVLDNVSNDQKFNLGFSPQAGFDIPIGAANDRISLGANVAYLMVTSDSPSQFSMNGVAKYWF